MSQLTVESATDAPPATPIVLGAAGHRNLHPADGAALKQQIGNVLEEFRRAYPHAPVVVMSSLAEGADQLAAETALEHGHKVQAPLPFAADVFRQSTSFDTEEGRLALDRLLAEPGVEAFAVPMPEGTLPSGTSWLTAATDKSDTRMRDIRRACYANAGAFVVQHCHALIALWDGAPADPARPSGTAEYVIYKLQGRAPAYYPWPRSAAFERGPVCAIHARRADASGPATPSAATAQILVPDASQPFTSLPPGTPLARAITAWSRLWRALCGPRSGPAAELWRFQEKCQAIDDANRPEAR
jgi:hypothetical protein